MIGSLDAVWNTGNPERPVAVSAEAFNPRRISSETTSPNRLPEAWDIAWAASYTSFSKVSVVLMAPEFLIH
jgi:hypothetical protein